MIALLSFILLILIVVSVHEYGHYWAAKRCGVRVLRFSVGFGKPLFMRRDARGTEWVIAPIPLGGYVRMLDRDSAAEFNHPVSESMEAKSHWQRIFIYVAGPLANLLLSVIIVMALFAGGQQGLRPLVDAVRPQSPAAYAGLSAGDEIAAVNGRDVALWRQVEVALTDAVIDGGGITVATAGGGHYEIGADAVAIADLEQIGGSSAAVGVYPYDGYIKTKISAVAPDSPAEKGGMRPGDEIVAVGGVLVERWRDVVRTVAPHGEKPLELILWREPQALTVTITPAPLHRGGQQRFYVGVVPVIDREALAAHAATLSYSLPGLVVASFSELAADVSRALSFLRQLVSGGVESRHVSGPVGIAVQSGEAAALGIGAWLRFITLISTSLAILNLLPLPLLDGGQILLSALQLAARREFNDTVLRAWNIGGVVLIMTLIFFVLVNDIIRLFF